LLDKDQANHDFVCVKSRLSKKLKVFVEQELPLLLEKGFLSNIAEFRNIAENCNTSKALVTQPGRELPLIERKKEEKKALAGIWTPDLYLLGISEEDRYLTKVTLYQAELPRQLNEQSNQHTL
jgi:hypothetical protein